VLGVVVKCNFVGEATSQVSPRESQSFNVGVAFTEDTTYVQAPRDYACSTGVDRKTEQYLPCIARKGSQHKAYSIS
jgi:hypothetical protein